MRPKEIILDFEDLCRKVKEGYSYSDISKMYNCSESIVARTIRDAGFSKKELDILHLLNFLIRLMNSLTKN